MELRNKTQYSTTSGCIRQRFFILLEKERLKVCDRSKSHPGLSHHLPQLPAGFVFPGGQTLCPPLPPGRRGPLSDDNTCASAGLPASDLRESLPPSFPLVLQEVATIHQLSSPPGPHQPLTFKGLVSSWSPGGRAAWAGLSPVLRVLICT